MIHFELPKELIAQKPVHPRDKARLLVYKRAEAKITDAVFRDLPDFLPPDSTLVINNSKVENCRWLFDGGKTEIFVLNKLDKHTVQALVRPGRRFQLGGKVELTDDLSAEVLAIDDDGHRTLRLPLQHDDQRLQKYEHIPLPPYIAQNDKLAEEYQTVYARPLGSKAAPTAGLHFTPELLEKLSKTHTIAEVTLHVGLGTFASPTDKQISSGVLHSEHYEITNENLSKIEQASRITAVGTTSTRVLETYAKTGIKSGDSDIFIQPGYEFQKVDCLITNFHLPGTSLLMLVEAFVGNREEMQRIYNHAIAEKYRFYSFGDAMLVL